MMVANMGISSEDPPKIHHCKKKSGSEIDINDPAVNAFLKKSGKFDRVFNSKMEIEFVRVLEDLIDLLIKKDVIMISDFNDIVIGKLIKRREYRERIRALSD